MDKVETIEEAFDKFDEQHNQKMEDIRMQMSGRIIDPGKMGNNPFKKGNLDFGNLGGK